MPDSLYDFRNPGDVLKNMTEQNARDIAKQAGAYQHASPEHEFSKAPYSVAHDARK